MSLPLPARHEACTHLIDLGLYAQARDLLDPGEPDDAAIGVRVSLLAGDVEAARRFLGTLQRIAGSAPLLECCLALASGDRTALERAEQLLATEGASTHDCAVFAAVAAPHDLYRASVVAQPAMEAGAAVDVVVPVVAAAAAAEGDYLQAVGLLEAVPWDGYGGDPVRRSIALLERHGLQNAADSLVAFGAQLPGLRPERRRYWEDLGRRFITQGRYLKLFDVAWVLLGLALYAWHGGVALICWAIGSYLWRAWVRLPGLDRPTSNLVRSYRRAEYKAVKIQFADVVAFLGGALIGMVAFAFLGRNVADSALIGFLATGLVLGSLGGASARRLIVRRLAERSAAKAHELAVSDVRCRCLAITSAPGPDARPYVEGHLEPVAGPSQEWQIRKCPQTGSYFLDWPAVMAAVRVRAPIPPVTPVATASPYL